MKLECLTPPYTMPECGECRNCRLRMMMRATPGFIEGVEAGLRDIEAGRFVTLEELTRELRIAP